MLEGNGYKKINYTTAGAKDFYSVSKDHVVNITVSASGGDIYDLEYVLHDSATDVHKIETGLSGNNQILLLAPVSGIRINITTMSSGDVTLEFKTSVRG